MNYTKQQLEKLEEEYGIKASTLSSAQQNHNKHFVDLKIIREVCINRKITLEQFLKLFEETSLTKKIEELGAEPYSSTSPLQLAILESENENGLVIDETLYKNRELIAKIRKYWWETK